MSLLLALRSATREVHERLEAQLDLPRRCRDRAAYADALRAFRSVYAPLERAIGACPVTAEVLPDWSARIKTPWLDEDLAALGVPVPANGPTPAVAAAEHVVGAAYVMEGATLGGALIVRELASLPVPPPHRFFTAYDGQRGARWHAFRRHVAAFEASGADRHRVLAAACGTFAAFERACATVTQ